MAKAENSRSTCRLIMLKRIPIKSKIFVCLIVLSFLMLKNGNFDIARLALCFFLYYCSQQCIHRGTKTYALLRCDKFHGDALSSLYTSTELSQSDFSSNGWPTSENIVGGRQRDRDNSVEPVIVVRQTSLTLVIWSVGLDRVSIWFSRRMWID
jgi:hypothetical protein